MTPYNKALHALGAAGGLTLEADGTYQILYLTSGYVASTGDAGHEFESDLGANISHRETVTISWAARVLDATDFTITDPNNGQTITQYVLVKTGNGVGGSGGGGTAATNRLIAHEDEGGTLSVAWDGTNDSQTFNASGVLKIGA